MNESAQNKIQALIGYEFRNPQILITAFTHASYACEHNVESNRRFEFLGDAVINFLSARAVFLNDTQADEGQLTRLRQSLVSKEPLAKAIRGLGLLEFLRVGKNESLAAFNDKSVSDLYEAVVGAIYYDSGELSPCEVFFYRTVFSTTGESQDYISMFKEWTERNPKTDVRVSIEQIEGEFVCTLYIEEQAFSGNGRTKKEAEREACRKACAFLK